MKPPEGSDTDDAETGLPGFRTWGGVYWFVAGVALLWFALLALFAWGFA